MEPEPETLGVLERLEITIIFQPADDFDPVLCKKEIKDYELEILREVRASLLKMRASSMLPVVYSVEKSVRERADETEG